MRAKTPKIHIYKRLVFAFAFALVFAGCGKLENFDADDFDLFGKDDKELAELRQYAEPAESNAPLVEYITDAATPQSVEYEQHLKKICDYAKFPFRSVDLAAWNATAAISPSTRVLCILETRKLNQASINKIIDFVANGGTLFMPFASEDKRIAFLIGFKPEAEYATDTKSAGFHFSTAILPNMKDKNYGDDIVHFGFAKENFSKSVRILATAMNNPNYPLVIENPIGKGKVFFYNTSDDFEKIDRGLLFSGLLKGLEGIPYPIANTSTVFLDDFPSPVYNNIDEPVKSEYNVSLNDFYKKIWWPDMEVLAKKYNISYSAMICFDYKNKVEPPFIFDQWDANKIRDNKKVEPISDWLVRDAAKNGHELAFHGYNHAELTKEDWPNQQFIGTALKAAEKKWVVSNFGPLPVTYVPPSNIIDKAGVKLVKEGMPSLKFMCSTYLGDLEEGGGREFDFDPYNKELFDYPRTSSGFYMNAKAKYAQESSYLFTGIWTHFVHPDDIYQIPNGYDKKSQGNFDLRNARGLGWKTTKGKPIGLLTEFSGYLQEMTIAFPQMRFVNAGQGGAIVNDWRASRFSHKSGEGSYTVEEVNPDKSLSDNQYWFLYAGNANVAKIEQQLKNESVIFSKTIYMDGYLYTIYTNTPKLTLRDLQYKSPAQLTAMKQVGKKVQNDYKRYLANVTKFTSGGMDVADDSDKKFKLELAALKKKMLTEAVIDSVTWNKYAKYMNWEDRGIDVWKMLEEHVVKHPSKENVMYSKELAKIVDYPNELSREKWMNAQLLVTPNDKDLLNSYVASYYTPENQERIRIALQNLLKVDTSFATYLMYIEHLLAYDPPAALEELQDKTPSADYKTVATDVAWLFANDNQLQKAYDWSLLSDEIDFPTKMEWLIELKSYKTLETEYKKYIIKHPDDYQSKAAMSDVFYDQGRFRDSWILANSLPESPEKDALRSKLNADVLDVAEDLQQELLADHSELFLPEVKDKLTKTYRKERGNFIAFNSQTETNKNDPSSFKNVLSYNFYDKKQNLHSIAATYSTMYKVNLEVKPKDLDNVTHAIGGIQYQFNNAKVDDKWQYWTRARVEYSDYQRFFYQFGAGINLSKEKNYKSVEFKIFPTETGAAHSKRIYRSQLNLYQDAYFLKYFNGSLSLQGDYYSDTKPNSNVKIGKSYEGGMTGRLIWDNGVEKKSRFLPFIEGTVTQASIGDHFVDPSEGYPYWIIDDRKFGGGGLGWKYGLPNTNLVARLEAAYFFDNYAKDFERYVGEVAYQIFDYTLITASFEVYTQSKYYSNALQFGVKYNLKKRQKK
ncbi:MAG TPA: DUF2194 domain-containing protein [Flavobacterium sp.]|nr:DUF2194 domain-containing protein [Flavobacterium sp.]